MRITRKETLRILEVFNPGDDGLAQKSLELTRLLLSHGLKPFSARQYWPGHITCTALVLHPSQPRVLVIHHHRLHRWLLPGGHVEKSDISLYNTAAREAEEETCIQIDKGHMPFLTGIDVHGIPPKEREPFHLHHDLIWCFRALSEKCETTPEAPEVMWAGEAEWDRLEIAPSIRNSIRRATTR